MLATAHTGEIRRGLGKNAGEWTGRVEISKEEIPGSKHSMHGTKNNSFIKNTNKNLIKDSCFEMEVKFISLLVLSTSNTK